jgi:hypothetical protein
VPRTCILPPGSNPDDCTTHDHEAERLGWTYNEVTQQVVNADRYAVADNVEPDNGLLLASSAVLRQNVCDDLVVVEQMRAWATDLEKLPKHSELTGIIAGLRTVADDVEDKRLNALEAALPRFEAFYQPQAWVRDYAVDVDAEGEQTWDCTREVARLGHCHPELQQRILTVTAEGDQYEDDDDWFADTEETPQWIKDRRSHGPFYIRITRKT